MSDLGWRPDLHERLARRAELLTRATRAAAAAAAIAIIGWLLGLSPGPHALAVLAGAAVVGALPLRRGVAAAFETIAEQAGLAYQTHIEHHQRDDPHGLLAAAAIQARLSIRGVTPPRQGAWWLPLAALALATWLLASVVGGPFGWLGGSSGPAPELGQPSPAAPPPPTSALDPETEAEPDADEALAPDPTSTPSPPSEPDRDRASGADDGAPEADGEGVEREALERFLESLRERPSMSEQELAAAEAERDGDRGDADAEAAELRGEHDATDAFEDGQRVPADRRDDAAREESAELPGGGDPTEGDGRDGDGDEQQFGEEAGDEDAGASDGLGEEDGEEGVGEEGLDASEETAPQPDGDGDEAGAPALAEQDPGLDPGTGEDAGMGASAPVEGHDDVPDPAGELEALPGLLGQGPESLGGRVRLPGRDSEVTLEPGEAARYERAVEQAVTDGSVPVTYQEIIRNYFR